MTGSNPQRTGQARQRGFTLFIAIVLATVALTVTLALTSLAYKSLLLSSSARESQYAFYNADTALECALYYDSGQGNPLGSSFPFVTPAAGTVTVNCSNGGVPVSVRFVLSNPDIHTTEYQTDIALPDDWFPENGNGCGRITVYKTDGTVFPIGRIYGDGVSNATCGASGGALITNARSVERGIKSIF
jgi:hypothetical protein